MCGLLSTYCLKVTVDQRIKCLYIRDLDLIWIEFGWWFEVSRDYFGGLNWYLPAAIKDMFHRILSPQVAAEI